MPGEGSCSNREKDQEITRLISGIPHLDSHSEWALQTGTSTHMINALRDAVGAIGEVKLGIKKEDVGTSLIRSGMAMAIYLGECPVFMIMLIGCWSSDAFLRYIRKQVMEFSQNVAKRILLCQNFRHIPDIGSVTPILNNTSLYETGAGEYLEPSLFKFDPRGFIVYDFPL
jgi:hypothetical protein